MADPSAPIPFDDIPLEDTRRMGRGPRMEPMLYATLRTTIQALSTSASPARSPGCMSSSWGSSCALRENHHILGKLARA
jgi:hypothetical protein